MSDLIDRQTALNTVQNMYDRCDTGSMQDYHDLLMEAFEILPSVQPEPLTDKEKRIFLAAMGREEKVCKQVDDECRDCREPYEDSLVKTCHEITRKVKGALWTI